jgi:hypothetical protein
VETRRGHYLGLPLSTNLPRVDCKFRWDFRKILYDILILPPPQPYVTVPPIQARDISRECSPEAASNVGVKASGVVWRAFHAKSPYQHPWILGRQEQGWLHAYLWPINLEHTVYFIHSYPGLFHSTVALLLHGLQHNSRTVLSLASVRISFVSYVKVTSILQPERSPSD